MHINPVTANVRRGELLRWAGWFAMANALVMMLIALRYLEVGHLSSSTTGMLFGLAMFPAHAGVCAVILWLPVFVLALVWPQRHLVVVLAIAIGAVAITMLYADTVVFQQYRFHINSAVLALYFSDAASEIFEFPLIMKLQLGLLITAIVIGQWILAHLVWRFARRVRGHQLGYALALVLVVLVIGTNLFNAYADAAGNIAVTRQVRLLPLYEPLTARGFLKKHGFDVAKTPRSKIAGVHGSFNYPRIPLQTHAPKARPNILWILIDSWRFDSMTKEVTPHIAQFARNNIRFMNHYSGGNATRMGIFSLFYGIPGTYWHSALHTRTPSAFMQRLAGLGYRIALFPSAPLTSPEFNRTVFAGLDNIRLRTKGDTSAARDRHANQNLLHFLDSRDVNKPFFGFIFYDSAHAYDVPDGAPMPFQPSWTTVNYLNLDDDTNPVPFRNLYKNAVYFIDGLVGKVLRKVRAEGLMRNTIIFITADHGQEFNDTGLGYWGHNGDYSRFQTKVPLVVHWPGKKTQRIRFFTSHYDVAATLMKRVLGVDNAFTATSVGHDLFTPVRRLPIIMAKYREFAAYTGKHFVVFPVLGPAEVRNLNYHLIKGAKPKAQVVRNVLQQLRHFRK